jgi:hypothetical protein
MLKSVQEGWNYYAFQGFYRHKERHTGRTLPIGDPRKWLLRGVGPVRNGAAGRKGGALRKKGKARQNQKETIVCGRRHGKP